MEVDTVRAGWSVVWSSHVESGKVKFEHGPPLWSACNTEDVFTSVNSSSFSIVLETDFCQCFCNSVAVLRQWWISPPLPVSVPLWDKPGDVPSLSMSCNIQTEVMSCDTLLWWHVVICEKDDRLLLSCKRQREIRREKHTLSFLSFEHYGKPRPQSDLEFLLLKSHWYNGIGH